MQSDWTPELIETLLNAPAKLNQVLIARTNIAHYGPCSPGTLPRYSSRTFKRHKAWVSLEALRTLIASGATRHGITMPIRGEVIMVSGQWILVDRIEKSEEQQILLVWCWTQEANSEQPAGRRSN